MTDLQSAPDAVLGAASLAAGAVRAVPVAALDAPTPCTDYTVRAALDHLGWGAVLFRHAAARTTFQHDWSVPEPAPCLSGPPEGWGEALAAELVSAARTWVPAPVWEGETEMAGSPMPASLVGGMVIAELALHGWDVARAVGIPYAVPDALGAAVLQAVTGMAPMGRDGGWYGPEVPVADDASPFDRALGLSGRDPAWGA